MDEFARLVPVREWVHEGDVVVIDHPKTAGLLFRVTKRNPRKFKLVDESGKEWNADHGLVKKAPEGTVFNLRAPEAPPVPKLKLGEVIEFTEPRAAARFPGMYVIANFTSNNTRARFVKLGGQPDGGYVTGSVRGLRVLTRGEILARL